MPPQSPSTLDQFIWFPDLPEELRRGVWELCMPRRLIKARYRRGEFCGYEGQSTEVSLMPSSRPPLIAHVNQEARKVAMQHRVQKVVPVFDAKALQDERYSEAQQKVNIWINTKYDICHNNDWTPPAVGHDGEPAQDVVLFLPRSSWNFMSWGNSQMCRDADPSEGKLPPQTISIGRLTLHLTMNNAVDCGLFGMWGEESSILLKQDDHAMSTKLFNLVKDKAEFAELFLNCWNHRTEEKTEILDALAQRGQMGELTLDDANAYLLWMHGYVFGDGVCSIAPPGYKQIGTDMESLDLELLENSMHQQLPVPSVNDRCQKALLDIMPDYLLAIEVDVKII